MSIYERTPVQNGLDAACPSQVPVLEVWSARGQGLRRKRKGTDSLCEMGLRDKF